MTHEEKLIVNRLQASLADVEEMQKVFDIVVNTLALREAELSAAKTLCARAADALEGILPAISEIMKITVIPLITELRKAAAQ